MSVGFILDTDYHTIKNEHHSFWDQASDCISNTALNPALAVTGSVSAPAALINVIGELTVHEGITFQTNLHLTHGPSGARVASDIDGVGSLTCNTLHYTTLDPALVAGPTGATGATGALGISLFLGNALLVDSVYGNDATASAGGTAYKTVQSANAAATSGQTVWIMPGVYTITTGLVLTSGVSFRGLSTETVKLVMNATGSATMLTMGENTRLEDCSLTLNWAGASGATGTSLKGVYFGGTSSQTSKVRSCVITVSNASIASAVSSTVYGIEAGGTGALAANTFSFNAVKATTINIASNGFGVKRGLVVTNVNQISVRDINIFVAAPTNPVGSTGSYVGIEAADTSNLGSVQIRTSSIGCVQPAADQTYTASDVLQTAPAVITNPAYLASAGIQIGPGVDLMTKSAGGRGFSCFCYPTVIFYGLRGNINGGTENKDSWLWPGTQAVSNNFPDTTIPPAYYRIQQPTILCGISLSSRVAPGAGLSVTATVQYTPYGTTVYNTSQLTVGITGASQTTAAYYNSSLCLNPGDLLHVCFIYTGPGNDNKAGDITVQVDLF